MQVLAASLPVGLASVDCDGTETSLLECSSSEEDLGQCGIANTNLTKATVLACGKTGPSALPYPPQQAFYIIHAYYFIRTTGHARISCVVRPHWPVDLTQAIIEVGHCRCTTDGCDVTQ